MLALPRGSRVEKQMLEEQRKWCACGLVIGPSLGDAEQVMPWCMGTLCCQNQRFLNDTRGQRAGKSFAH